MKTKYVKKYITPIKYIIQQYRDDGVIRNISESHSEFVNWLSDDNNILEIIPFETPAPKELSLDELKENKKKEILSWYNCESNKPLKVTDTLYICQTKDDLDLWEKGIKGFLMIALKIGYFQGDIALTEEEALDLSVSTVRGSVVKKAANYMVSVVDYYGNTVFITIAEMVEYTLKLAEAYLELFLRYHFLKNTVNSVTSVEQLNQIRDWNSTFSTFMSL